MCVCVYTHTHILYAAAAAPKSLQLCSTLCNPIDSSPLGSAIPGILQARTLEWGCHFLLQCMKEISESEVTKSCLPLSDPIDCSPPGSSIHGIFQARVLELGATAFSASFDYLHPIPSPPNTLAPTTTTVSGNHSLVLFSMSVFLCF